MEKEMPTDNNASTEKEDKQVIYDYTVQDADSINLDWDWEETTAQSNEIGPVETLLLRFFAALKINFCSFAKKDIEKFLCGKAKEATYADVFRGIKTGKYADGISLTGYSEAFVSILSAGYVTNMELNGTNGVHIFINREIRRTIKNKCGNKLWKLYNQLAKDYLD